MRRFAPLFLLASVAAFAGIPQAGHTQIRPVHLRCEYRTNPLGIGETKPRLSWKLESTQRGALQAAYQILAANTADELRANRGTLWDSGKIASDQSLHIVYAGKNLGSRQRVWWKVRVWERASGRMTESQPAFWEMGLLQASDWKGQWIGRLGREKEENVLDVQWIWFPEGNPRANAPQGTRYFRRNFPIASLAKIKSVDLYMTADNTFVASLNGKRVGSGETWQAMNHIPLTEQVNQGENALTVAAYNHDGPAGLAGLIKVTLDDGSVIRYPTNFQWSAAKTENEKGEKAMELGAIGIAPWQIPNLNAIPPPNPYLRKSLILSKPVRRARIYASALGLYQLRLNGARVGKDHLTPGWTDYNKRVQYQTYDVTAQLKQGENVVGLILGDGWYCGHVGLTGRKNYGPFPLGYAQLEIEHTDGTMQTIVTDSTWRVNEGAIRTSDLLMGEVYDAREERKGWDAPGYNASSWAAPHVESRRMQISTHGESPRPEKGTVHLTAACTDAVQQVMELRPKRVTSYVRTKTDASGKAGDTTHVYDLGQNMVGWVRLKVRGPEGSGVRLRFAEMLNPDGSIYTTNLRSARCTDYYILKGQGVEVYEPTFTFHGFRYVEVEGYPGPPLPDAITGVVVSSLVQSGGTFECSNPMVNQLQSNIVWGQRGNYLEVPTDCPQRDERLGWMGDAQVFIRTACANFDVAAFMTKWIQDVRDAQSAQGAFPDVAPRIGAPSDGAPAWGDAGIIVPWTLYRVYGDTRLIERHYPAMQRWIAFILEANPDFLWRKRSGNNYGDWLSIRAETPRDLLGTAYFAYSTRLLSQMARALGKTEDAQKYEALFQQIRAAFQKEFVRADGRVMNAAGQGDTQTCYLVALRFDLLPEEMRPRAAQYLAEDILTKHNGHLSTGFVGVGYLNPTLTEVGRLDLAYRLLNNDTFPSWGYSIKQGATTIWERWDGWTVDKGFQDPSMNSFNHYSLGSVGEWLFHTVAGIDLDPTVPAYKKMILRPRPGGGLTYARASYESAHGRIVSDWKLAQGQLTWKVRLPANTSALVYVPTRSAEAVQEGGRPANSAEGVRFVRQEEGSAIFEVGSGEYVFTVSDAGR
jgi:alpha-L-rhamnosidase